MKKIAFLILILFAKSSTGQQYKGATKFTKFIEYSNIEWASYNLIHIDFKDSSFNFFITNRYKKNEIKGSLPFNNISKAFRLNQTPISYDSLEKIALYPSCILPIPEVDSLGNLIPKKIDIESYRTKIDTPNFKAINLEEIIYIENGKLYSYIPFGSICTPLHISGNDEYLGEIEYFSTFFNFQKNKIKQPLDKILQLRTVNKLKIDSINIDYMLKELYGRNLLETLWPYITSKKIGLECIPTNTKVDVEDNLYQILKTYQTDQPPLFEYINLRPNLFTEIELVQDWYYNEKENIITSEIKEVYLCAKKANESTNVSYRIIKLIF